jgi:very-short-patch-repair endonuclease
LDQNLNLIEEIRALSEEVLNLTNRNPLINMPRRKANVIQIVDELPNHIIEKLESGQQFDFKGIESEEDNDEVIEQYSLGLPVEVSSEVAPQFNLELPNEVPDEVRPLRWSDNTLQTNIEENKLYKLLNRVSSYFKKEINEKGYSSLFLAIGFLKWKESPDSERIISSPLYLYPIEVEHKKGSETKIKSADRDVWFNICLSKKLERLNISLPKPKEAELPEEYLARVNEDVVTRSPHDGWAIERQAKICFFNYMGQSIAVDIEPEGWEGNIEEHELINTILLGRDEGIGFEPPPVYDVDEHEIGMHLFPPLDADSSQISAMIDVIEGKSIVIHGPPGTGKSQTIANLISCLITSGKRVLFVAEKRTALDVVNQKLINIGLGEFSLAIHSEKTKKHEIFESLSSRMAIRRGHNVLIEEEIAELKSRQKQISDYLKLLHSTDPILNMTLWEMIWRLQLLASNETRPNEQLIQEFEFKSINEYAARLEFFKRFKESTANIVVESIKPWALLDVSNFENSNVLEIDELASSLSSELEKIKSNMVKLCLYQDDAGIEWIEESDLGSVHKHLSNLPNAWSICFCESLPTDEVLDLLLNTINKASALREANLIGLDELPLEKITSAKNKLDELEFNCDIHVEVRRFRSVVSNFIDCVKTFKDESDFLASIGYETWSTLQSTKEFLTAYKSLVELSSNSISTFDKNCLRSDFTIRARSEIQSLYQNYEKYLGLSLTFYLENLKSIDQFVSYKEQISELEVQSKYYFGKRSKYFKIGWYRFRANLKRLLSNKKLLNDACSPVKMQELVEYVNNAARSLNDTTVAKIWHGIDITTKDSIDLVNEDVNKIDAILKLRDLGLDLKKILLGVNACLENSTAYPDPNYLIGKFEDICVALSGEILSASISQNSNDNLRTTWREISDQISRLETVNQIFAEIILLSPNSQHAPVPDFIEAINHVLDIAEFKIYIPNSALSIYFDSSVDVLEEDIALTETALLTKNLIENGIPRNIIIEIYSENPEVGCIRYKESLEMVFENVKTIKSYSIKVLQILTDKNDQQLSKLTYAQCVALHKLITTNRSSLDPWARICKLRQESARYGLKGAIDSFVQATHTAADLCLIFEATCLNQQIKSYCASNNLQTSILGTSLNQARNRYRELDEQIKSLKSKELFNQVLSYGQKAPSGSQRGRVGNYTEMGLVRHVASVPRNRQPLRSIFQRSILAMTYLKPCLMMSPATVAEFLPKKTNLFDVVIIDEASQVKPGFAYGSITRSKQMVIVGDPKQLPPTNFFATGSSIEEDPDEIRAISESESILDAVTQAMPAQSVRLLNYHYRSEHQSLISFSNNRWYNNDLIVFPAPSTDSGKLGVELEYVPDGFFENGVNQVEAKRVAEAVIDFCEEHSADEKQPSLGIATLNRKQADLIEDLLDAFARQNTHHRELLQNIESCAEPLFINNLERVQGEERDVIFISYTYGKNLESGKVRQGFGPINHENGWRRLNVLYTRAKQKVKVFSSCMPGEIIGGPTSSDGVNAFRDYLIYAENGGKITEFGSPSGREPDSDFEVSVANATRRLGVEVDCQIGVAGYFIDLGVRPVGQQNYILGIECDGATYHSSKSARDRDRVRQDIIESKGWRIHRIWSTDWFENPEHEIQKLRETIQGAMAVENMLMQQRQGI